MQILAETNLFDFDLVIKQIPDLLKYLPVTLELAALAMCIGIVLGLLLAVIRLKKIPVLRQIAAFYISIIRGTPAIVQLYIAYFGIPMFLKYMNLNHGTNFDISAFPGFACAVFAMGFNESAYNAETIRAALGSVDRGQIEAASAIGMTYPQMLRRIILPEAMTVALPGLGNSFIGLIKGTSLAFTCAVVEMTAQGKIMGGRTYRYFEVYVSLAIIYWAVTIIVEQLLKFLERRLELPEQIDKAATSEAERQEEKEAENYKYDSDTKFEKKLSEQYST
ncbi:MAG: amino acid ABC transporter permease [Ruminococcus sp.]|nr:amino acid ABC transporter permease [Ruminococcus sp.]